MTNFHQNRVYTQTLNIFYPPLEGPHIKKLKGRLDEKYRYHLGDLHIIYFISVDENIIYVDAIGPRGDVYK